MKKVVLIFSLTLVFSSVLAYDIPKFTNYVNDYANVLTDKEETQLNQILKNYQDTTSTQIAFLIIPNYNDRKDGPLVDYSVAVFKSWKIGEESKNNGILFVIVKNLASKNGPGLRIATGYGVEGALPDAVCRRIIESTRPLIKDGKYYQGIHLATSDIISKLKGEFKSENEKSLRSFLEENPFIRLILIIFLLFLFIRFVVFLSSPGSGGSFLFLDSSSSDSGGGFSGGGCGDCGGGGAGD